MGAHIIRRSPANLLQPAERRPTTELTEQQLHALINLPLADRIAPPHPDAELEAELELIDVLPEMFPDATPEFLPRFSSPRFAHTTRRDLKSGGVPTLPQLHGPDDRIDISTILMPRQARPTTPAPAPVTAGTAGDDLPSTERPTRPAIPRPLLPSLAASEAEPSPALAPEASPASDVAATEIAPVSATPKQPRLGVGRARVVLPIVASVLALGAGTLWLLQ
jgi:hypothetical protein